MVSKTQRAAGQVEGCLCGPTPVPEVCCPAPPPLLIVPGTMQPSPSPHALSWPHNRAGTEPLDRAGVAGHFWLKPTGQMDPTVVQKAMWEQGLLNAMGKEAGHRTLMVGWKEH